MKERNKVVEEGKIVSDILKGDFAPIEIPLIEIPGSKPLVFEESNKLLA